MTSKLPKSNLESYLLNLESYLLIDASETGCSVQAFQWRSAGFELKTQFRLHWDDGKCTELGLAHSEQLRQELDRRRITIRAAVLRSPPHSVLLKRFPIAPMEDQFVPNAVLIEAESRGISPEDYCIDFVRYPDQHPLAGQVCIAAMPQEILQSLQDFVIHAGLELKQILSRSLDQACAVEDSGSFDVHLRIEADTTELALLANGYPLDASLLPHDTENTSELGPFLTARVKLLLHAWRELISVESPRLCLSGPLAESCSKHFQTHEDFSGFEILVQEASAAEAGNSVLLDASRCFDFVSPKRSPSSRTLFWQRARKSALICILAASLAALFFKLYCDHLDKNTQRLTARLNTIQRESERDQALLERAQQLTDWQTRTTSVGGELVRLMERLPSNKQLFLQTIRYEQTTPELPAEIKLEGSARTLEDALKLNQDLLEEESRYNLRPGQFDRQNRVLHYPIGFEISGAIADTTLADENAD